MKTATIAAVLVASLATTAVVACGGTTGAGEPEKDPPVAIEAGPDAGPAVDSSVPDAPITPTACSPQLVDPKCTTTIAAPTTSAAISKFVTDTAVPLRCGSEGARAWDLHALTELYGDNKMFMIGEVHGQNEIGIVSSLVFDQLAQQKRVNVLGFEMPMDYEAAFQRYIDTGKDSAIEQILPRLAKNFFATILTKSARELAVKGIPIRVAAVDIPTEPSIAVTAIQAVAEKLTTQKSLVLTTLPTAPSFPPSDSDKAKANSYFDTITSNKTQICTELSAADCDRLVAMTHAMWAATFSDDATVGQSPLWFARREEAIYYNMKTKLPAATDRMFLHMGAHHTNKAAESAGSRMAHEYPLTQGKVFSVAPAYGSGSVIFYGQDMNLDAAPVSIVDALTSTPANPFFVSTLRPSSACVSNPIALEPDDEGFGHRSDVYDGYIHYGNLTSERRPNETTLSREDAVIDGDAKDAKDGAMGAHAAAILAFRARIVKNERAQRARLTRP